MTDSLQRIQLNKTIFEDLKHLTNSVKHIDEQIQLIEFSAWWAAQNHTGLFSDFTLEKLLSSISKKITARQSDIYKEDSYLHVMTESYLTGGHTRIVEKWVNSSDKNEQHSLLLLNQHSITPNWLIEVISHKNGTLYNLTNIKNHIEKASKLRTIASSYEYIVLHTHVYDVSPILAFGTEEFQRPIIFVNHSDHLFWLGISIIDMLTEGSRDAISFTKLKRGLVNQKLLPVPLEETNVLKIEKIDILKKLNLPTEPNVKFIVSMASSQKYRLEDNNKFILMALEIINKNEYARIIVIGPDKNKEKEWLAAYEKSNGKIDAVGLKKRDEVNLYKKICDIYIDSFPFNSYTSFLEFAVLGIPSFALKTVFNDLDILKNTPNHFKNIEDLVKEVSSVLSDSKQKNYNLKNDILQVHDLKTSWVTHKKELITNTPKKHQVNWNFSIKETIDDYDKTLFLMNSSNQRSIFISKKLPLKYNFQILRIYLKNHYITSVTFLWQLVQILRYQLKQYIGRNRD